MPGAFHEYPVTTNTVPSVWLCIFFGLHMLTSACTALGFLLLCRLNIIWGAARGAQTSKHSPQLHLPLYNLIHKLTLGRAFNYTLYGLVYTCKTELQTIHSFQVNSHQPAMHYSQCLRLITPFSSQGLIPAGEQPSLPRGLQLLFLILFPQIRILHLDPITNYQAHPEHGRELGMEPVLQVLVGRDVPTSVHRVPGEVQNVLSDPNHTFNWVQQEC